MAKFMILYYTTVSASELMANASREKIKASIDEWLAWRNEANKVARLEFGSPLQAVSRVTPDGVAESDSHVSGYSVVESESEEALLGVLQKHPHLQRPGASIDVLEMLSMPGL